MTLTSFKWGKNNGMNYKTFLVILLMVAILFISCDSFVLPREIRTEDDLLEIYTMSIHINDFKIRDRVIAQYNLTEKKSWLKYSELLLEMAKDVDKFQKFKENSIDKYVEYVSKNKNSFEAKIFHIEKYDRNFRYYSGLEELTENDLKAKPFAIRAYVKEIDRNRKDVILFEYYESGMLRKILYKNEFALPVKEEIIENDEIVGILYIPTEK